MVWATHLDWRRGIGSVLEWFLLVACDLLVVQRWHDSLLLALLPTLLLLVYLRRLRGLERVGAK